MNTLLLERPRQTPRPLDGGRPARRAVTRWAWRLFRREWRRQLLVLALLIVAIAATIVGLGTATNAAELKADPAFGTADSIIRLPGSDPQIGADLAAIQSRVGPVDVIAHRQVPIPGSVATLDVRAEDPHAPFGGVTLRVHSGRYPNGGGEIAFTSNMANTFGLHVGSNWQLDGQTFRVVGIVENPLDLTDQFALVPPGQANPASEITVLLNARNLRPEDFRLPSHTGIEMGSRGTSSKQAVAALVLVLASLGLVFVGLLAVAGFTVMAQRRLRSLGMFRALGATDRHLRRVVLANGAAVGITSAVVGTAVGLAAWFAFVPSLTSLTSHRIDPFSLPWWAIGAAIVLTIVTAVAAAWWPARAAARISVVAALSGRPPRPQPAHRFAALGSLLVAAGITLLCFADQRRPGFIISGTVLTPVGVLFLAPLAIRGLAAAGRRATISVRLALRDLVRYQARSGAALGAVTLAIGIAATISISAAASETPNPLGNLPANQIVVYLYPPGRAGNQIPPLTPDQLQAVSSRVASMASELHASVLALQAAYNPRGAVAAARRDSGPSQPPGYLPVELDKVIPQPHGLEITDPSPLYVATPALLGRYGINPAQIGSTTDIVSARADLGGLQVVDPGLMGLDAPSGISGGASKAQAAPSPGGGRDLSPSGIAHPSIETLGRLPLYTSSPSTLITTHAMQTLGLEAIPAAWLIQAPGRISAAQVGTANRAAAVAGLYVESRTSQKSLAPLRNWSTAVGALVALGVLGMTVGLIRSETANDLRTLTAAGASSTTRRALTGATSGALALLGALLGTGGAYAALLAWHRSDLSPLGRVPVANLVGILVGIPVVAAAAGWVLAGREPSLIARQPLE